MLRSGFPNIHDFLKKRGKVGGSGIFLLLGSKVHQKSITFMCKNSQKIENAKICIFIFL
jgi:hypothetical protein